MITIFKQDGVWKGGKIFINMEDTSMGLPKLDTVEEQQEKRFERSKPELLKMLDVLSDIEYDLNTFSDYLGEDELFVAKVKINRAYALIREVINERTKE